MNEHDTTLPAIANVAGTRQVVSKQLAPPMVYQCMVVSPSEKRGKFFQDAALDCLGVSKKSPNIYREVVCGKQRYFLKHIM